MEPVQIKCQTLRKLIVHPKFMKDLYQLGVNARQKRESCFSVYFKGPSKLAFTPIVEGGVSFVSDKESAHFPIIVDIHNHPAWGRVEPFDFFSKHDLWGLCKGEIIGLVSSPRDLSLMLLLAQARSPQHATSFSLDWYDGCLSFMEGDFLNKTRKALLPEEKWMAATVKGLTENGFNAAAVVYVSFDALRTVYPGGKYGDFRRFKVGLGILKKAEELMVRSMYKERTAAEQTKLECGEKEVAEHWRKIFPYEGAKRVTPNEFFSANRLLDELGDKGVWGVLARFDLAKQMIEKGIVEGEPIYVSEGEAMFPAGAADFMIGERDREKLKSISFFTLDDISIKLDIPYKSLLQMLEAGQIMPDFVVEDEGRKEWVFLSLPAIQRK